MVVERLLGVAVLDDLDARRLARARGLPIVGSLGILRAVCRDGELTWDEGWAVFGEMVAEGVRFPRLSRHDFEVG
ncbi:MAG TPA: hypothetical protein VGC11_13505 [Acidimicrobiia bacterium]